MGITLPALRRIVLFSFILSCYSSCSTFDKPEGIPSYIHIDKINFIAGDTTIQGTASNKITDAWVYIDDHLVGTYELPCTFPVQYEGTHTIQIAAGIKMNGISSTRIKYPFYDYYNGTVTLEPKKITQVNPSVSYFQTLTYSFIEDFEAAGYCLTDTFGTGLIRTRIAPESWGSGKSAFVKLTGDTIDLQARSSGTCGTFLLQANGHSRFIELNYRSNHAFIVGLTYGNGTNPIVGVNPSVGWNKIYINISDQIFLTGNYGIYIAMLHLGSDTEDPYLYFDNIKLIQN